MSCFDVAALADPDPVPVSTDDQTNLAVDIYFGRDREDTHSLTRVLVLLKFSQLFGSLDLLVSFLHLFDLRSHASRTPLD